MARDDSLLEFSALATVTLAHDLQNLLAIMAGCVDSLGGRTLAVDRADRDFAELNEAIDSAFHLSRELLTLVGRHQAPDPVVLDVHELIRRFRGMLGRIVGERIRLSMDLEAVGALVEATAVQVEWILLNLAANGRDAMPAGGVLHIHTVTIDRWTGTYDAPIRYLRLTVRDDGAGIAKEARPRLFEPFFTTRDLGTGLGLTSVAVTVRALRGWLYVDGPEDAGTTIHVLLPLFTGTTAIRPGPSPG
jgi:two-component system cell cycle sensor histidine kinase/response regulator CckA